MSTNIQTALKNCLTREADRLKEYDWFSTESVDKGLGYLIGGAVMGFTAPSIVADAGSVANLPAYAEIKAIEGKAELMAFVSENATLIMAVGTALTGAGAYMFLKGLAEENQMLRKRAAFAFNKLGHGIDYIKVIEKTYDQVLATRSAFVADDLAEEKEWINRILKSPSSSQLQILASAGTYAGSEAINTLRQGYMHGVKKMLAHENGLTMLGREKLRKPTHKMETVILSGMTDYYIAADKKAPGILNKLQFVLTGNPESLKKPDIPSELAAQAFNAVLELKGKTLKRPNNRLGYESLSL